MRKITVSGVLSEGIALGLKNAPSLLGAVVLWILTIWIPYINVGTTIAICSIPVALSSGGVVSPLFIFEKKYRDMMGEYFMLVGLMSLVIVPAAMFLFVPAIVIGVGWSLAIYLLIDRQVSPTEALTTSNKATMGYKWTIFGVQFLVCVAGGIVSAILGYVFGLAGLAWLNVIVSLAVMLAIMVTLLGCDAVIYKHLTRE